MGETFIQLYNDKIKSKWKITFIATMVIGLLTHMYKFTNLLMNHDSVWNMYSDQNMIGSGRWFLSIACMFSSYFDLPWVNGLFSLVFIALTAIVITEIFNIDKPIPCVLIGGILVTFPTVTATMFYEFTADGYMLAMLLSAIAVYITTLEKRKVLFSVISVILLCLACGIYQAYILFGAMIIACDFVIKLIEAKLSNKDCFKYLGKYLAIFASALALYFVVWKVLMKIQGVTPTNYQGIDSAGQLNISVSAITGVLRSFGAFFIREGIVSVYSILNILFIICLVATVIFAVVKKKMLSRKLQVGLLLVAFIAMPYCVYLLRFVSPGVFYHTVMLQSISMIYILSVIIAEKYTNLKLKNVVAVLLTLIIFNFSIMANKAYYLMELNNTSNYALSVKITSRVEQELTSKDMRVALVGEASLFNKINDEQSIRIFGLDDWDLYGGVLPMGMKDYISNVVGADYNWILDEELKELSKTETVKNMPVWPLDGSVKVDGDTIIVKLAETKEW